MASKSTKLGNLRRCKVQEDHPETGLHQGSVPSPQLFLFYIDDLHLDSGDLHIVVVVSSSHKSPS